MNPKIMKLRGELEKNKGKISDLQGRMPAAPAPATSEKEALNHD